MLAPLARILLRYLGGILIAKGYAHDPATFADPDLVQAVCIVGAGACGVISEGWWYLARKHGWGR
jgi:hypothetical protein